MNNQGFMVRKNGNGLIDAQAEAMAARASEVEEEKRFINSFETVNNGMMMRRDTVAVSNADGGKEIASEKPSKNEELEAPEKNFGTEDVRQDAAQPKTDKTKENIAKIANAAQNEARKQVEGANKSTPQNNGQTAAMSKTADDKPKQAAQPNKPIVQVPSIIKTNTSPDALAKAYVDMFKEHFDMDLSMALCYDNMRRFCETDAKHPDTTLYFLENTYRLSTLLYLSGNLPIMIIATILADKNRKNVLKYVTTEVENGAKPYSDLKTLRINRYARKCENMNINDAITVTPGATLLTSELIDAIQARFDDICLRMKKFNKDLGKAVAKLDDAARNDVVYIYSNCWYFLQGFENVVEMRSYVMSITDDTRRNLKI